MSAVMGTMRKMEDSPMDDKMTMAARPTSNGRTNTTDLQGGCCHVLQARKKPLVKRRRRQESRPSNGHFRKRTHGGPQKEEAQVVYGDVPMDLSKRTGDETAVRASRTLLESNGSRDAEQESEEQPLNLSRNTRMIALRCDSSPNAAAPAISVSSSASPELLQKRSRLEEMVSYIRKFSVVDNNGRHKTADCGASDANPNESDDDAEGQMNAFGAVKRSLSCSSLLEASPVYGRRHRSAAVQQRPLQRKRSRGEETVQEDAYDTPEGGYVSYPVLRQQLLGVDRRHAGLLQSVAPQNYTKDNGEYEEEEGEAGEEEEDAGEDSSERENEDNEDSGAHLHHQRALLDQHFPWATYAYYANLFQEMQGSLASGAAPATLPLSLAMPLAMPATAESRGASPLSSEGILMTAATPTSAGAGGDGGAANAMFRKRAPRALTGKHVKHGTGASPATLLTLRQKIEQKRKQQATAPAHVRTDRKTAEAGRMHKTAKAASASLLSRKKKVVS